MHTFRTRTTFTLIEIPTFYSHMSYICVPMQNVFSLRSHLQSLLNFISKNNDEWLSIDFQTYSSQLNFQNTFLMSQFFFLDTFPTGLTIEFPEYTDVCSAMCHHKQLRSHLINLKRLSTAKGR